MFLVFAFCISAVAAADNDTTVNKTLNNSSATDNITVNQTLNDAKIGAWEVIINKINDQSLNISDFSISKGSKLKVDVTAYFYEICLVRPLKSLLSSDTWISS